MAWIESIPLPALRVDRRGRIREGNKLAAKFFRRANVPLLGARRADLASLADGEGAAACELPLERGTLLLFSNDAVVEQLQQQVYHLARLASAGRLVAVVVHEINNALSGILGYAQLLLQQQPAANPARRDLERIHDEALRTARVARNLLRFSRGGRGERSLVDVAEVLERCAELKKRDFALRQIRLETRIAPGLPPLEADEALLSQVFLNLLTNAQQSIAAARPEGVVRVAARLAGRRLVVDVADDGTGIPAKLRERVFEPFFTSRPDGGGTGLGLTLCRDILRDHGGQIRVVARRVPGACLRVELPVAKISRARAPAAARRTEAPDAERVANARIVVVEDEPSIRDVVSRAFAGDGNRIVTFERGEDALPWLVAEPVDLVVSDVHRPGLDGMRLWGELARARPLLTRRFLFVTGDTVDGEVAAFLRRARAPFVAKPLRLDELRRAAKAIVERSAGQGELFAARAAG
jgi:two-component system NtrC family sensor kinase